jgi:hypothetical protein
MTNEQELELLHEELRQDAPSQMRMEDIHPRMSKEDRERTLETILRVLRGDE